MSKKERRKETQRKWTEETIWGCQHLAFLLLTLETCLTRSVKLLLKNKMIRLHKQKLTRNTVLRLDQLLTTYQALSQAIVLTWRVPYLSRIATITPVLTLYRFKRKVKATKDSQIWIPWYQRTKQGTCLKTVTIMSLKTGWTSLNKYSLAKISL
jgi:hypothetical protein